MAGSFGAINREKLSEYYLFGHVSGIQCRRVVLLNFNQRLESLDSFVEGVRERNYARDNRTEQRNQPKHNLEPCWIAARHAGILSGLWPNSGRHAATVILPAWIAGQSKPIFVRPPQPCSALPYADLNGLGTVGPRLDWLQHD